MELLAHGWHIPDWHKYIEHVVLLQILLRIFISLLSATELWWLASQAGFFRHLWGSFCGFHTGEHRSKSDLLYPLFLGLIEQGAYPILMATGSWTVIGAWIGFKTVAQWRNWTEKRTTFNRYLIGNALVVVFSFFLMPEIKLNYWPAPR